ncbi:ArsR family transcriptional regulator [Aquipluma nitroreducens]|nr:ArsR family transcriptional regulator [Aquipluma nitroreducens]
MIEGLITSKTRIRLLLKFFLNSETKSYLRSLESEFGESSNSIRVELNKMEKAKLLNSTNDGNKKMYFANISHPLFEDINNILKKFVGIDQIIDKITSQLGDLQAAYLTGDFATGQDSQIIDMVLIGNKLDRELIDSLVLKAEEFISRSIKYIILSQEELIRVFRNKPVLLIWRSETINACTNLN